PGLLAELDRKVVVAHRDVPERPLALLHHDRQGRAQERPAERAPLLLTERPERFGPFPDPATRRADSQTGRRRSWPLGIAEHVEEGHGEIAQEPEGLLELLLSLGRKPHDHVGTDPDGSLRGHPAETLSVPFPRIAA